MEYDDDMHERTLDYLIATRPVNATKQEKALAQRVLNQIYSNLICDAALYGMRLSKLTNVETLEKDVTRLVHHKMALEAFIKAHINDIAYLCCLKDPSEPEPKPKLKLVVNNNK